MMSITKVAQNFFQVLLTTATVLWYSTNCTKSVNTLKQEQNKTEQKQNDKTEIQGRKEEWCDYVRLCGPAPDL